VSTDLRALGRLGQPFRSGRTVRRRRPITRRQGVLGYTARREALLPAPVRGLLGAGAVLGVWVLLAAALQDGPLPAEPVRAPALASSVGSRADLLSAPARSVPATPSQPTVPLAAVDGVDLVVPHPDPVLVAYHEAVRRDARELAPIGTLDRSDRSDYEPGRDAAGVDYRVLSSRGRGSAATSAVDVVLPDDAVVRAPVTGTVREVRDYSLYGETRDYRVVIAPAGSDDVEVVAIHLLEPEVEEGDSVVAGETALAEVRRLPFQSHVDTFYRSSDEPRLPHVHLEVRDAAAGLDLDDPAVEPESDADR